MSEFLGVRLTATEGKMLDWIVRNGFKNRGEAVRCLVLREYNQRKKLAAPKASDYQSAPRLGSGRRGKGKA